MTRETAELLIPLTAFAYGAVIGSFLNVVIHRLPRADEGLALSEPKRSFCPKCGRTIPWRENIPLVSYLLLGGKCGGCKVRIPIRYFLVELITATLFAVVAQLRVVDPMFADGQGQWGVAIIQCLLLAAMVAVTFIDIDHEIIPDRIDKPGLALGLLLSPLFPGLHAGNGDLGTLAMLADRIGIAVQPGFGIREPWLDALLASGIGAAVGGGIIYGIGVLGKLAFRKEAMGFGDVKYMAMLGAFIGWKGVLLALMVASIAGSVVGIAVKLVSRYPYIPFGPFLSLGALSVLLWRQDILWLVLEAYPRWVRSTLGG